MGKLADIAGLKFGLLTAVRIDGKGKYGTTWNCTCDCGGTKSVATSRLKGGVVKSCGCLGPKVTSERSKRHGHAHSRTPTYRSWEAMIRRTSSEVSSNWADYGGRGISVCDGWKSFDTFLEDMGERPTGTTLDRYPNGDGDYEPSNCRWSSAKAQTRNRAACKITMDIAETIRHRVAGGEMQKTMCAEYGLSRGTVSEIVSRKLWT